MARTFTDSTAYNGETLSGRFSAPGNATAVRVELADGTKSVTVAATKSDGGLWHATATVAALAGFSGATRWVAFADTPDGTEAIAGGEIYIRPLVSPYRAVVAAVEEALKNYGNNPNMTVTAGEISFTYKDYKDLLGMLDYWRRRVAADERGTSPRTGGIHFITTEFK